MRTLPQVFIYRGSLLPEQEQFVTIAREIERERAQLVTEVSQLNDDLIVAERGREQAEDERDKLKEDVSFLSAANDELRARVEELEKENKRLREALEEYAKPAHWQEAYERCEGQDLWVGPSDNGYEIAEQALEQKLHDK